MNWDLWKRQLAGILRLELKKSFLSKRAWWIYLLALGPLVIATAHTLTPVLTNHRLHCTIAEDNIVYAVIFQLFYLRLVIFFGCVGIFSNLFRGEVLEKTLHYYFLSPVRREVLVAGKFLAGLCAAITFFAGSAVLTFIMISAHFGPQYWDFIVHGPGLAQLGWYFVTAALACIGYGSVFLVAGLLYRNPMIPAAVVMLWEGINLFLPAALRKISVVYYLLSICPVEVPLGRKFQGMALLIASSEQTTAWIAIPGLLLLATAILFYAGRRARRMEISYSE